MEKNVPHSSSDKSSNVKEISDGVYINLNRITTDDVDFEKAIEESFKEVEENQDTATVSKVSKSIKDQKK
jgi:hypothetical protein